MMNWGSEKYISGRFLRTKPFPLNENSNKYINSCNYFTISHKNFNLTEVNG